MVDITQVPKLARGCIVGFIALLSKYESKGFVVREHGEPPALKVEAEVFYGEVRGE